MKHETNQHRPEDKPALQPPVLRVGVISNGPKLQAWQVRSLECLENRHAGSIVTIVEVSVPDRNNRSGAKGAETSATSRSWLFSRLLKYASSPETCPCDLSDRFPDARRLSVELQSVDGRRIRLDDDTLDRIGESELDFILNFTDCKPTGNLLNTARYGVWEYDLDGHLFDPSMTAFFWPVRKHQKMTIAHLHKASDTPEDTCILRQGIFPTSDSFQGNIAQICRNIHEWPAAMANQIRYNRFSGQSASVPLQNPIPTPLPGNFDIAGYLVQKLTGFARLILDRLTIYTQWNIGVADLDFDTLMRDGMPETVHWAPLPGKNRFFADPFALDAGNHINVLFEDYQYTLGKGIISSLQFNRQNGWSPKPEKRIVEDHHLSYPFLFQKGEKVYSIPEANKSGHVYIYELDQETMQVREKKEFIENFHIVDPTLFFHEERWWLFGDTSSSDSRFNLRIWYADSPTGPWTPHPLNPVSCDISSARPAGPIISDNGHLYRPGQNSTSRYGEAISLMEILKLTPTEYEEKLVTEFRPHPSWQRNDGIHTMGVTSQGIIIDANKRVLSFLSAWFNIQNIAKRILGFRQQA